MKHTKFFLKVVLISLCLNLISFVTSAQTQSQYIKAKIEDEVKSKCRQYSCTYIGPVKLTSSTEKTNEIILEGTVKYQSKNCGEVNANFNAKCKVILDDIEITCFVLYMPWCLSSWVASSRVDAEYTIGCCGCK